MADLSRDLVLLPGREELLPVRALEVGADPLRARELVARERAGCDEADDFDARTRLGEAFQSLPESEGVVHREVEVGERSDEPFAGGFWIDGLDPDRDVLDDLVSVAIRVGPREVEEVDDEDPRGAAVVRSEERGRGGGGFHEILWSSGERACRLARRLDHDFYDFVKQKTASIGGFL